MARALDLERANAVRDRYVEVTTVGDGSSGDNRSVTPRGAIDLRGDRRRRRGPLADLDSLKATFGRRFGVEPRICAMARVTYESKDNAGHKFWVARYGRYAIRIDATRRGVYPWLITLEGRSVRNGVAPDRDQAADAVSDALDELPI
jgi:hypothetical protein